MERNLSLFNQINSLAYWFLLESHYKASIIFDAEKDYYHVSISIKDNPLYTYHISNFSKKSKDMIRFELRAIAGRLLHIKEHVVLKQRRVAV